MGWSPSEFRIVRVSHAAAALGPRDGLGDSGEYLNVGLVPLRGGAHELVMDEDVPGFRATAVESTTVQPVNARVVRPPLPIKKRSSSACLTWTNPQLKLNGGCHDRNCRAGTPFMGSYEQPRFKC